MQPTHIKHTVEKLAMGTSMTKLGPRPDRWITEVIQRLHEDHPYLAQYALQGKLVSSDPERLYGVGYVEARTPTESKVNTPAGRIPFVIEAGMLHPMKVFMDAEGRSDLLDKNIFAEALFSHPISLSLSERGEDPSLIGQLYPPDRTRHGMTGGLGEGTQMKTGSMEKGAFKPVPLLAAAGGALGAAQGEGTIPTAAGAAGGAAGLAGGYRAGKWVGGTLGAGIAPGGQRAGEMIGGALGGALGGYGGSKMMADAAARMTARRRAQAAMQSFKYSEAEPYFGEEAEQLLADNEVRLTAEARRGIHKKAMAQLNEQPRSVCILDKIAHTIQREDQVKVAHTIINEGLENHFVRNGFQGLVQMALADNYQEKTADLEKYDVVQLERLGQGQMRIKTAQADGFAPTSEIVSVQDASSLVGEDLVGRLDADGRLTMTTQPAIQETLDDIRVENIDDYGIYKVQELESGDHVIGWVITNVIDFEMNSSPLMLFSSGRSYALQESIAGVRVSMGQALPRKVPEPGDTGVFYYAGPSGRVTCTLPVNITHVENFKGQNWLAVVDTWGKPMRLTLAPQLKKIVEVTPEGEANRSYAIPDYMMFMPLREETRLVPDTMLFSKLAAALQRDTTVEIISDKSSFSMRGTPVEKLASEYRNFISDADVEFTLAAMGVPIETAREKLGEAYVRGFSKIAGVRPVITVQERQEKIAAIAAAVEGNLAPIVQELKRDTVKIAAELPDIATPESVDAVLSLNFITPDNLTLFIESLPHLTLARRDLAELYSSSLLGMPDVPRQAAIRGMEALRDICQGLRKVKMRAMLV